MNCEEPLDLLSLISKRIQTGVPFTDSEFQRIYDAVLNDKIDLKLLDLDTLNRIKERLKKDVLKEEAEVERLKKETGTKSQKRPVSESGKVSSNNRETSPEMGEKDLKRQKIFPGVTMRHPKFGEGRVIETDSRFTTVSFSDDLKFNQHVFKTAWILKCCDFYRTEPDFLKAVQLFCGKMMLLVHYAAVSTARSFDYYGLLPDGQQILANFFMACINYWEEPSTEHRLNLLIQCEAPSLRMKLFRRISECLLKFGLSVDEMLITNEHEAVRYLSTMMNDQIVFGYNMIGIECEYPQNSINSDHSMENRRTANDRWKKFQMISDKYPGCPIIAAGSGESISSLKEMGYGDLFPYQIVCDPGLSSDAGQDQEEGMIAGTQSVFEYLQCGQNQLSETMKTNLRMIEECFDPSIRLAVIAEHVIVFVFPWEIGKRSGMDALVRDKCKKVLRTNPESSVIYVRDMLTLITLGDSVCYMAAGCLKRASDMKGLMNCYSRLIREACDRGEIYGYAIGRDT